MKIKKTINYICSFFLLATATSCTDLSETVYDQIVTDTYYQNKEDVVRAFLRPFEHAYWSVLSTQTYLGA